MQKFSLLTIHTEITTGGAFSTSYSSRAIPVSINGSGAAFYVLLILEVFYVLGLLWNMLVEAREMAHQKRTAGTVLSYFESAWNFLDILSLTVQCGGVALWCVSSEGALKLWRVNF